MPSPRLTPPLPRLPSPRRLANLIGGRFVEDSEPTCPLESPYTGTSLGQAPLSSASTVDQVVAAAREACGEWARTPLKERCGLLLELRQRVLAELDPLSHCVASESGKTVDEAKAGILKGIEVCDFAISLQNLEAGSSLEVSRGVRCEARREPLGVVAGITPFNFPAMVPMWMFPIALTLGNAFILKPSEKVPLTAQRLGELACDAGYPPGVFSIVHGATATAQALVTHPGVAAVGFVGSSRAAGQVYAQGAAAGKRVLALGGAKNTLIWAPDADLDLAVNGIVASFTGCAGQRCMAGSLLVVVGDARRQLPALTEAARRVSLGQDMGALIDRTARERLEAAIARALDEGATLLLDGRSPEAPAGCEGGYWLGPTLLHGVRPDAHCATQELFGPVLSIVQVDTLDEALAIEQRSPYGNATSVFTQSGRVAQRVSDEAKSGMIGINVGVPVPREPFSFGGTKQSRFGHGDITGAEGVAFWSQLKKVTTKWAKAPDTTWMSE